MKKILEILILSLLLSSYANASNHYPITRDSKISIARGELLYNQYCASCHMSNLSGAKNWKSKDKLCPSLSLPFQFLAPDKLGIWQLAQY